MEASPVGGAASDSEDDGLGAGVIVAIVLAAVLVLGVAAGIVFYLVKIRSAAHAGGANPGVVYLNESDNQG